MPAIQAMRSDALALRAKEDVQEKIPSFFNSVSQALGQNIISGQDAAEQLIEARFAAANALVGQIRQKVDGDGGISEMAAGAGFKMISSALSLLLSALSRTTTTDLVEIGLAIANFIIEAQVLKLQWDAVAATHAQWVVQAGYSGQSTSIDPSIGTAAAIGGRGALKYRDAFTPRFTSRAGYANSQLGGSYTTYYGWGSVGSITRIGQYP